MKTREDGGADSWGPVLQGRLSSHLGTRGICPRHTCGFPWARSVARTLLFLASLGP